MDDMFFKVLTYFCPIPVMYVIEFYHGMFSVCNIFSYLQEKFCYIMVYGEELFTVYFNDDYFKHIEIDNHHWDPLEMHPI